MILDKRNEFADATALSTAATGLALVGDVIDLGTDGINEVDHIDLLIQVDTAVTSGGNATVEFQLVSDAQAAIAVDGSATVHFKSAAVPKATLVAGYTVVNVKLPKGQYERYLGILQNVGTAALTAGKINAGLTPLAPSWKAFDAPSQA
jgi:hypothetical protein